MMRIDPYSIQPTDNGFFGNIFKIEKNGSNVFDKLCAKNRPMSPQRFCLQTIPQKRALYIF